MTPEQAQAIRDRYTLPKKYILGFGTLEPRKNWQGLIDAFTALRPQVPDVELVLAGASGWKNSKLREQIVKTPGVRYIGEVPEEDKANVYRLATAFVYPSLYEGFGFPVLEAALCRVPIVTSNRTSLPHLLPGAVVTVNPLNRADIASGIRRALGDSAWRVSAVPRACELAAAYDFTHTAQALAKLFVSSV
jgi:glycosyltransferase involved in cell wall biosynthesis